MNWNKIVDSLEQADREKYRIIVFGQERTDVLLVANQEGLVLPSVEIRRWQRPAEHLTAAVRRDWGCDAICLFTTTVSLSDSCARGRCYQAMECLRRGEAHPDRGVWASTHSLTRESFQDEADFSALQQSLTELDCHAEDPASPFTKAGWFAELQAWVADVIRPRGLQLTGPFCQLNASPSFSLIRFETNGPNVWFKAVGEPSLREFETTLALAQLFPQYLPNVLDTRPEWNGWLSLAAGSTNLSETQEISSWEKVGSALARLQMESVGKVAPLLDSGVHDLRADTLSALVDPFLGAIAQLMERQTNVLPPVLSPQELKLLGLRIQDSITLLDEMRIHDALGHLDLNPGNIILSPNKCVFVDWAEAYVGHPFFTFAYLLEHFRRAVGTDVAPENRLVRSYGGEWRQLYSVEVVAEALTLAPLAAVFAYAVGTAAWRDQDALRNPQIAGYFRSLARRMYRDALQFVDRRSPCLS